MKSKVLICICAAVWMPHALAQLAPGSSTALFEISRYSPGLFGGKWSDAEQRNVQIVPKTATQFFYKADDILLFDAQAVLMTNALPSEAFDIQLVTDKTDRDYAAGKAWNVSFVAPPAKGSRCAANVAFTFKAVSAGEKQVTIKLDGKDTGVKAVSVKSEGSWTMPAECNNASGKGTGEFLFAPELGLLLAAESAGFFGSSRISGAKLV